MCNIHVCTYDFFPGLSADGTDAHDLKIGAWLKIKIFIAGT
jgi:hypothetical protein